MECLDHESLSPVARDHAGHPRNYGPMDVNGGHARVTGECGETMEIWLEEREGKVERASFITDGCAPSIACGSMATGLAVGMCLEDVLDMRKEDILEAFGGFPKESEHCALLAVSTLKAACEDFLKRSVSRAANPGGEKLGCGTCGDDTCSAKNRQEGESEEEFEDRIKLRSRLCRIGHKIVVLSGKGGVGKSTVAVNLASALVMSGKRVGLLDVDIHGPSVPTMLGLEQERVQGSGDGLLPIEVGDLKVMSLGFLLRDRDDAVIWRGPMKMGVIKQFLKDVAWGDLDYLVIDSPPGTGDEPLSVCQLAGPLDGAVVVTTPQKVAAVDVRKSVTFCHKLDVPVLGVVENMGGFACPKCGEVTPVLLSGGGRRIAEDMDVPFLGSIPMDPEIARCCDEGDPFVRGGADGATARAVKEIMARILDRCEGGRPTGGHGAVKCH